MTQPTDADLPVKIVCLGEALVEFNQQEDGRYLAGHGGDTSNTAIAVSRQQTSSGYISRIGNDPFGQSLVDLWTNEHVDYRYVYRDDDAATGIYFVTHGDDGHEFSYYRAHSAASAITPADIPEQYIGAANVLHISAISQAISDSAAASVSSAINAAKNANTLISYDTNLRLNLWAIDEALPVIIDTVSRADIVLPGYDDATQLTGRTDSNEIVDFFLNAGAKVVGLTLGAEGSLVADANHRHQVPALGVDAVDATGAGDTFDGAFLSEWLATNDLRRAAIFANAAAALSTTGYGAVAPIPTREMVEAAILG